LRKTKAFGSETRRDPNFDISHLGTKVAHFIYMKILQNKAKQNKKLWEVMRGAFEESKANVEWNLKAPNFLMLINLVKRCLLSKFWRFSQKKLKAMGKDVRAICKRFQKIKGNCERNLRVPRF
jgi:hypothetical protein